MASQNLINAVQNYENYISAHGIDEQVIDAYIQATNCAFLEEKDVEYGLKVSARAKELIKQFVISKTGGTVWDLEEYSFRNKIRYEIVNKYYDILKLEAQNKILDSYLLYLERNREIEDRFYLPKREQFLKIEIIQALQDMLDDKLDLLTISLPPGTGKAQPLYSKVLTPNGFIPMGEVKVGTKVISGTGNVCNVTGVYPQGVKPIYEIILENGYACRCSTDHLWNVRYNYFPGKFKEKTVELNEILLCPYKYLIPVTTEKLNSTYYLRVGAVKRIGEEECQCIMVDDESHLYITDDYIITHNTTLSKFFISGVIGWFPKDFNLFWSHSGDIARMYYDGCLEIVTNNVEYTWGEVFPDLSVTNTNAKMGQFNVGKYKPFPSLQTTSNGAENAGKVRADKFLMLDDLIGKLEEALNKTTLDKLWSTYSVDAKQRKTTNKEGKRAKEIHIATRWSTNDVIGHLQLLYGDNERCKFIAVPDIDPETGESNFNYKYQGLDVEYFNDQALTMDDVSYRCLFKNQPIEREGLLYPEDSIERYYELPKGEPEEITGQCDHKGSGTDFMFMFAAYKYGDWYYIEDVVCNRNPDYEIQYQDLTNLIVRNEMQNAFFESNQGGDRVSLEVDKRVQAQGHVCNITAIPTETNKEARIYQFANWIKQHCKFKDKSKYSAKSDYAMMMNQLFTYSVSGKNPNDDIPDGLAIFAKNKTQGNRLAKAEAVHNPFRTGGYGYGF